jgi:hypothetical protein
MTLRYHITAHVVDAALLPRLQKAGIVGIKSDRFVVIDNGSIMIAFVRRNAPVAKGESALGIKSDRFCRNQRWLDRGRLYTGHAPVLKEALLG